MKRIEEFFGKYPLLKGFSKSWEWLEDVNSSLPFYSPLLYLICKGYNAKHILEIGCDNGYTSYMLANAAKENGGVFYGIEISEPHAKRLKAGMEKEGFPHKIVWANSMDLKNLNFIPHVDFALLDGNHSRDFVVHEFELIYPKMTGIVAIHDANATAASGVYSILKNPKYNIEFLSLPYNLGMTLFRKKRDDEEYWLKTWAERADKEDVLINWPAGKPQEPGIIEIL